MNTHSFNCEFCQEIYDFASSRVGLAYRDKLSNRIVAESKNFIVVPTIGQIVSKSMLILPKEHYESFAEIPAIFIAEAQNLISFVEATILKKDSILFEHGAKKCSNSSCGVYHAHIHIVPLGHSVDYKTIVGHQASKFQSLEETLSKLKNEDNYVMFRDINLSFYSNTKSNGPFEIFQSQYFRKWLVRNFNPDKQWDWKKYNKQEPEILELFI